MEETEERATCPATPPGQPQLQAPPAAAAAAAATTAATAIQIGCLITSCPCFASLRGRLGAAAVSPTAEAFVSLLRDGPCVR